MIMCIKTFFKNLFKPAFELTELQQQLEEVKLQLKEVESENQSLKTQLSNAKRVKEALLNKIENLKDKLTEQEINTGDDEFIIGDDEFTPEMENSYYEAIEAESQLLAKELMTVWPHREGPCSGFSNIEWGGVSSNIMRGLKAYVKEGDITEEEQQDINWMFDMFDEFNGHL
jgi:regulator of replication initiation timing